MFEKQNASSSSANLDVTMSSKLELKKIDESSNVDDLAFYMEQEEDLYATLDDHDHDSLSSENMNSFNKTTYLRNDEVTNFLQQKNFFLENFHKIEEIIFICRMMLHYFHQIRAAHTIQTYQTTMRNLTKILNHLIWRELILSPSIHQRNVYLPLAKIIPDHETIAIQNMFKFSLRILLN